MEENKYLLLDLNDARSKSLAEVLSSKKCKKIIEYLSETKEASEKDLSDALKMPLNTLEYNLKKLIKAEMVEKNKNFFWSKKGKKIPMYSLSEKSIIIRPKSKKISSKLKTILPVALLSLAGAFLIKTTYPLIKKAKESVKSSSIERASDLVSISQESSVASTVSQTSEQIISTGNLLGASFLLGAIIALTVYIVLTWERAQ